MDYTRISALAVASCVLGASAPLAFVAPHLVVLAIAAIPMALIALRTIRQYELLGSRFVIFGLCLSVTSLVLAPAWHLHRYTSEALPHHARVDFAAVGDKDQNLLDQYDNQAICLKGYAIASREISPREFSFSPNGDDRSADNTITVELPFGWGYRREPIAVSGTLLVNRAGKTHAHRYIFKATAIRIARTPHGLAERALGNGC